MAIQEPWFALARPVAVAAANACGIQVQRITPLAHAENTTFCIYGVYEGLAGRFVVRIHRDGYHTAHRVRSELDWLQALRKDLHLTVPEPVPVSDTNELVQTHVLQGILRHVVVFRWVSGRMLRKGGRPVHTQRLAQLVARLHQHAAQWDRPELFSRLHLDTAAYFDGIPEMGTCEEAEQIARSTSGAVGKQLQRVVRAAHVLREWGHDRYAALDCGTRPLLIHADLHLGNVVFSGREVCPIDFDDSAFSHPMIDLAVVLRRSSAEHRHAAVAGYRSVQALPEEWVQALPVFICARQVQVSWWAVPRVSDSADMRLHLPRMVERLEHLARQVERQETDWLTFGV